MVNVGYANPHLKLKRISLIFNFYLRQKWQIVMMNMTEEKAVKNLEGKEMIMKGEKKEEVAILENLGTEKGKPSMYGFVTQLITFKFIAAWIFCAFIQSLWVNAILKERVLLLFDKVKNKFFSIENVHE